ncbi:MAG TPA: zf-HC2 domain-containing protein [Pyrinomonadaceae bacterium]|nr:zf-HC2 domain-containing protein [Pyrinomonadaceae bacterium]
MKQETNNEMDLLLRRLGRRPETSISDGNGDVEHLDADELSAYAENVVPGAARARYTEHLAECTRCRELVAQLSSSAAVVPAVETVRALEPSALKKFLSSLFSPMVLRYAVPALGLILVAAIGLFVLQQKKTDDTSIARNVEAPTSTSITTTATPEPVQPPRGLTDLSKEQAATKPAQSSGPTGNQPAAAAPEAPATGGAVGDTSRDVAAKKEEPQPVVTEAQAPPAPKPAAASDESKRLADAEARKETSPERYANEPPSQKTVEAAAEAAKVEERKAAEVEIAQARADSAKNKNPSTFSGLASVTRRPRGQRDDDTTEKDKNDAGETRTVAGRQFRKQGGSWIDTAYSSVRVTTNLTRGSEQYRALIADEPGIKTIADQLDGEVIVVWKGRAYRIK